MIELAQHGALIGVGFWDGAVCDTSPEGVARAIQYGIDLLGVDHIALGSDYDGATEVAFDSSELSILTEHLLQLGDPVAGLGQPIAAPEFQLDTTPFVDR